MSELQHPEFEQEKLFVQRAYERLEASREAAKSLTSIVESNQGGTHQARFERDVISDQVQRRLDALDIGDQSLVFGRLDNDQGNSYHIGRVAVFDEARNPMVVDWRAPAAEPFYRATGIVTMGLVRRRHFISRFRELLGLEDEFFTPEDGENTGALEAGEADLPQTGEAGGKTVSACQTRGDQSLGATQIRGRKALTAAIESGRTGRLGDIVGTIQAEQDEIIRAPLAGLHVVQGGPGTGKTVVALHRAAYLLYTHRFPLAGQGVMVIGPNRLFLTYIEQVLPSLGESGVELAVLGDFVANARVRGNDSAAVSRIKGSAAMAQVVLNAVRQRQRPLREDFVIAYGVQRLKITVEQSRKLIERTRSQIGFHNQGRRLIVERFWQILANSGRYEVETQELIDNLAGEESVRSALEWMWPTLSPTELIHDLYGSKAMLSEAGAAFFGADIQALHRPRSRHSDVIWTTDDVAVLDEAEQLLGPRSGKSSDVELRTYGHIVIDEAQDLSPLQLRMIKRRSLNSSLTVVGDVAQATSVWDHKDWEEILSHLPSRKGIFHHELTIGYRLSKPLMDVAAVVLKKAMPELSPPTAVRVDADKPVLLHSSPNAFEADLIAAIKHESKAIGAGNLAVICATDVVGEISEMLNQNGVEHGLAYSRALEKPISVIGVSMVKGLEVDAAIVIEPDAIAAYERQGLRALYVALTRATRRLTVIDTGNQATVLHGAPFQELG